MAVDSCGFLRKAGLNGSVGFGLYFGINNASKEILFNSDFLLSSICSAGGDS